MASPILSELSVELAEQIVRLGMERTFAEGSRIFAEGEKADFLPTVLSGRVKMVRFPEPGKEVIIGTFAEGEIFAIPPALDGKAFPATAVAMEDTRILIMPRDRFLSLMADSQEFSRVVLSRVCGILRERSATIEILASPSAEQRVARVLLSIAEHSANGLPLKVTLRRQDVAEMAGLTLESTIRTIRKLADRGDFKIVRGKIVLESLENLRRLTR